MKKIYILFMLIGVISKAQVINIPDANFKAKLLQSNTNDIASTQDVINGVNTFVNIDTNNDGEIQQNEAAIITYLDISFSNISSLTGLEYFTSLQWLKCNNNQIATLNLSPLSDMVFLDCSYNQIVVLDFYGLESLMTLSCSHNQLTSLDLSNNHNFSFDLFCGYNNLEFINVKNGAMQYINTANSDAAENNPNLTYVCVDDDEVEMFQDLFMWGNPSQNININTYCSFNPGGAFYTLQGNTKYDGNNDGCDSMDSVYPKLKLNISNGVTSGSQIANTQGNYSIAMQAGTYTITPELENPLYYTISPTTSTINFPNSPSPFIQNYCITANGTHNDLEVIISPQFYVQTGYDAKYKIVYRNKGTNQQSGVINLTFDDNVLDFVSANPVISSSSTNSYSWNFTNLEPFETRTIEVIFNLNSPTDTPPLNNMDELHFVANILGLTDETPNNNSFTVNQFVANSFDPNNKICLEGTSVTPSTIGEYVHYTINFENLGTANAQNVVVKDIIDSNKFDVSTLQILDSSNTCIAKISEANKVEFIFENINLPFDASSNDGYVTFKIKTKPSLIIGDSFSNTASIYFDYNFPIATNTATTTIDALTKQDFDFSTYFAIAPNPAKETLNFESKDNIQITSVSIYNSLGQQLLVVSNPDKKIDVSSLKTGNYFIKIVSDKGISTSKFVKI